MHQSSFRNLFSLFCVPTVLIGLAVAMDAREPRSVHALQELVNSLKGQLGIDAIVSASIVPTNPLLVSVQPVDGGPATFQMAFEERFLTGLDEDDIKAIIDRLPITTEERERIYWRNALSFLKLTR